MKDKNSIVVYFTPGPATGMLEEITASYVSDGRHTAYAVHNRVTVPATAGEGFIACSELFEGMYCMMLDITAQQALLINSRALAADQYYLVGCRYGHHSYHFTDADHNEKLVRIDHDCIFVHSTRLGSSFRFPAGQRHRAFLVIISRRFALRELRLAEHPPEHSLAQELMSDTPFCSILSLPLVVQHRIDQIFEQPDTSGYADFVQRSGMISAAYYLLNQWYLQYFKVHEQQAYHHHASLHEVMKVKELYISDFERPPMTVEELARMCNMSVTKFKSVFKSLFGMSCYQYYQAQRMEYAKMLLGKQGYPVKEVSYLTGFQNTANFTRSFKKAFDMLPREFQRKSKYQDPA
ncbi:AraC family transcriptional regulator [uncultured Chitinophaga sp.]|jgi:AraC-type DNA-binding domain-containing proteins|uniref:helix-turn-helix transcriptional regulator n=1 Tax=uncultured Chitinophaga sp. TaxID=339340 RepID=UPI0026087404|nr:AraC family transcriptional regulator [uncultured Chitinophaga sp.]